MTKTDTNASDVVDSEATSSATVAQFQWDSARLMLQNLLLALNDIEPTSTPEDVEQQIVGTFRQFDIASSFSDPGAGAASGPDSIAIALECHGCSRLIELACVGGQQLPQALKTAASVIEAILSNLLTISDAASEESKGLLQLASLEADLHAVQSWLTATHDIGLIGRYKYNFSKDFVWWSEQIYRFYGLDPAEGQHERDRFVRRLHPEDRQGVLSAIGGAVAENRAVMVQYRLVRPDGSLRHLRSHQAPERDGDPGDYFGVNIDVTECVLLREQVRRRQHELGRVLRLTTLGELSASLTHELAQPLTAIVASAGAAVRWLDREKPDFDAAKRTLEDLAKARRKASSIVDRLREFARRAEPEEQRVAISDALLEVLPLVESEAARRSVSISSQIGSCNAQVLGDKVQLQQLFMSLALVAMKRTNGGEQSRDVLLSSRPDGDADFAVSVQFNADHEICLEAEFAIGGELWLSEKLVRAHAGTFRMSNDAGRYSLTVVLPKTGERTGTGHAVG